MNRKKRKFLRKSAASFLKRFYIFTNGGYSVGRAYGARFLFDWRYPIDKKVAVELYEYEQISFMCKVLDRLGADMMIDIGAHAGLYSIIARTRHPQLEIHAFEPDRTNLCQLYANLFINNLQSDINVHEHGLSNHDRSVSFITSADNSSRATRRISATGDTEIMVKRLDEVLDCRDRIIAIKIDVEGHELQVVDGARELLASNKCFLQIEARSDSFDQLRQQMNDLGYRYITTLSDHFFTNTDISV